MNVFKEAVQLAKVASEVMEKNKADPKVAAMCKLVIGDNNYDDNYKKVQGLLALSLS